MESELVTFVREVAIGAYKPDEVRKRALALLAAHDAREGGRGESVLPADLDATPAAAGEAMNTPMTTPMSEMDDLPESVRDAVEWMDTDNTVNPYWDDVRAELLRLAARVKELERYAKEADRRVGEQFGCAQQAQAFAIEKQRECLSATTELAALKAKIAEAPTGVVNRCALNSAPEYHITAPGSPLDGHRVALLDLDAKEG